MLYYAEVTMSDKIEAGGGLASENEDIASVELTLDQAMSQIGTGDIADAKTIIGLYWLSNRLNSGKAQLRSL